MTGSPYHYDTRFHRPMWQSKASPRSGGGEFPVSGLNFITPFLLRPRLRSHYTALWVDGVVTLMPTAKDASS